MIVFRGKGTGEGTESEVSVGFVLKILWGTKISLDGDGGFRSLLARRVSDPHPFHADPAPRVYSFKHFYNYTKN